MYIIKNFGLYDKNKQLEILNCFKMDGQLLFQHIMPSIKWIEKQYLEQVKEEYLQDFIIDMRYYYDKNLKNEIIESIKDILVRWSGYSSLDDIENVKQKLYNECIQNQFNNLPEDLLNRIKEIVLVSLYEKNIDRDEENFVNQRKSFQCNYFIDDDGEYEIEHDIVIWYKPICKEEYLYAMEIDSFYRAIVLEENKHYKDWQYAFAYYESAEDYDLIIFTQNESEIDELILERIKAIDDEILKNLTLIVS